MTSMATHAATIHAVLEPDECLGTAGTVDVAVDVDGGAITLAVAGRNAANVSVHG